MILLSPKLLKCGEGGKGGRKEGEMEGWKDLKKEGRLKMEVNMIRNEVRKKEIVDRRFLREFRKES